MWVYAASAAFDSNLNGVVLFGGGSGGVDQILAGYGAVLIGSNCRPVNRLPPEKVLGWRLMKHSGTRLFSEGRMRLPSSTTLGS